MADDTLLVHFVKESVKLDHLNQEVFRAMPGDVRELRRDQAMRWINRQRAHLISADEAKALRKEQTAAPTPDGGETPPPPPLPQKLIPVHRGRGMWDVVTEKTGEIVARGLKKAEARERAAAG